MQQQARSAPSPFGRGVRVACRGGFETRPVSADTDREIFSRGRRPLHRGGFETRPYTADTATRDITVGEALNKIRDGCWKNLTSRVKDKYEKAYNTAKEDGRPDPAKAAKKAADSLKRKLPATLTPAMISLPCVAASGMTRISRRCSSLRQARD